MSGDAATDKSSEKKAASGDAAKEVNTSTHASTGVGTSLCSGTRQGSVGKQLSVKQTSADAWQC